MVERCKLVCPFPLRTAIALPRYGRVVWIIGSAQRSAASLPAHGCFVCLNKWTSLISTFHAGRVKLGSLSLSGVLDRDLNHRRFNFYCTTDRLSRTKLSPSTSAYFHGFHPRPENYGQPLACGIFASGRSIPPGARSAAYVLKKENQCFHSTTAGGGGYESHATKVKTKITKTEVSLVVDAPSIIEVRYRRPSGVDRIRRRGFCAEGSGGRRIGERSKEKRGGDGRRFGRSADIFFLADSHLVRVYTPIIVKRFITYWKARWVHWGYRTYKCGV